MPRETVQRLHEMLPGAIGRPPSLDVSLPPPIDALPGSMKPMLRVFDGGGLVQSHRRRPSAPH